MKANNYVTMATLFESKKNGVQKVAAMVMHYNITGLNHSQNTFLIW